MKKLIVVAALLSACVHAEDEVPITLNTLKVDISEVALVDIVRPVNGITSSGQPDQSALSVFKDSGYAAVIDLRGKNENRGLDEQAAVEDLEMRYVSFPITGREAINFDNARRLNQLIQEQEGPVLVHCGSGNRVGALLALIESLDGADDEMAVRAGKAGGLTGLEDLVRERLQKKTNAIP